MSIQLLPQDADPTLVTATTAEHGRHSRAGLSTIRDALAEVRRAIAPVWPLQDYVAVNPYAGLADQEFLNARDELRRVSDLETFMPVDYYRQQFGKGEFERQDIDAAVDELVSDGVSGAERIDVNQVVAFLREESQPSPTADAFFAKSENSDRQLHGLSELYDRNAGTQWTRRINEELSKHCAAHYDQGQAAWASGWSGLTLYQSWRSAKQHDLTFEILGVSRFRKLVQSLPHDPSAALILLLEHLEMPRSLWADFLKCEAFITPGWTAWTNYQHREAEKRGEEDTDLAGLLAIRLAYEVALLQHEEFQIRWDGISRSHLAQNETSNEPNDEALLRYALLKASEIAFRRQLAETLPATQNGFVPEPQSASAAKPRIQMVFCIDVRSERMRRHLESASNAIETYGFAGFFGVPIEHVPLGSTAGTSQVPVLISPQFQVQEELGAAGDSEVTSALRRRKSVRNLRKAWKEFQNSAVSMFAFVETAGLLSGFNLLAKCCGFNRDRDHQFDGIAKTDRARLSPSLEGLETQGVSKEKQAEIAESMLRGIGIVDQFADLIVLCGHGCETENNPLKAGLECGACGGHSGEFNARFAAKLLNQSEIRDLLAERGITIPNETRFVAGLHNTTTDSLTFFDRTEFTPTQQSQLDELIETSSSATRLTRKERIPTLPGSDLANDLDRRSQDWSEIRPEWGLAGNAAFIAAPRAMTRSLSLDGRAFLHSYDQNNDPDFSILEQIMTAPMVVANWINLQYYASTVDPIHLGSGNKTVHNVVGRFGILSGNGGDLQTGLPWQSLHDGRHYQHHPLRLLAMLAAPRAAIESVLQKHAHVSDLVRNGWMQLIAIEEGTLFRFTGQGRWEELSPTDSASEQSELPTEINQLSL